MDKTLLSILRFLLKVLLLPLTISLAFAIALVEILYWVMEKATLVVGWLVGHMLGLLEALEGV